jgi:hypothetical protein
LVVDNKWTPTKYSVFVREVFKWVLTVGLSGIIIYALTQLTQPETTETEIQLKEINKNLETVSKQLDKISEGNSNLKNISITTDSIAVKTKEILKTMRSRKQNSERQESRPHNTGFASGGVTCKLGALCFYSSSVQVDSFVLRNPPERQARDRYQQA